MKKILVFFALLFAFIFNLGINVKAVTQQELHNWLLTQGIDLGTYESSFYNGSVNEYGENGFGVCWICGLGSGQFSVSIAAYDKNYDNALTYAYPYWKYNNSNTFNSYAVQYKGTFDGSNIFHPSGILSSYSNGCYLNSFYITELGHNKNSFIPPIDWDTVYYSANILPPDLDITYRELSSVPIVDVPLNVNLVAEPQNVYVEIGAIFFCPDEVDARADNGVYNFNTLDTTGFAMTIIDKEDLVLASNASSSYIHLALNEAWQDVYDQIPMSYITWHTDPNYSTNLVNNMKSRFENIRKVCCFYGNELRLFVRYFVINNNTQFVVGSWRVWYSKTPNTYTDQTPTWYQPYIPASGMSGTSTNTGSNTQQDPDVITIPPGSGQPTGIYYNPSTNITVGSNVPNYPDYPTIRSYNADNFLVQTMNYLDYLNNDESEKTLFGEFGKFLATVFVFIPGEIWTIIAVGFSLVIVVMFLKIL